MKKSFLNLVAVCGFSLMAVNVYADQRTMGMDMAGMKMDGMKMDKMPADSMSAMSLSDGVVKAVDKENSNITLKHGRIKSATVEMGPMTMSFPVKEKALLSNVKVGDKVKFTVENIDGTATVTILSIQK
ncbi:copper-binding protein [Herminiimonas contaminans]|jgi:Cu(I)/Ag(I) efflux system protein CusF|uniref:Copper-binding protein n=1 Tax=Herminiimonas contaminans TaxID=1111140 RepID=A0ABS0EWD9_9BURK|nr:copper-binding protein [Herminiimonas contaminans]MBF8179166.1 copper-binding protein [Herminiimonas contaminans]